MKYLHCFTDHEMGGTGPKTRKMDSDSALNKGQANFKAMGAVLERY